MKVTGVEICADISGKEREICKLQEKRWTTLFLSGPLILQAGM
ncbi:hypothetical protein PHOSAC3_120491 [Mesotoga infera]|nr:hypothetical protein PHOSAC3_120491 [Mesotoga infera]